MSELVHALATGGPLDVDRRGVELCAHGRYVRVQPEVVSDGLGRLRRQDLSSLNAALAGLARSDRKAGLRS